jgi:hypothetical protein
MEETASTLFGLPTYFIVIAVIAFVLVVAGMTVYTVVMNRIENESEDSPSPPPNSFAAPAMQSAPSIAPPEPLHGWLVMAAAFMDNGASWLTMPVAAARDMLGNGWGVDSPASLEGVLASLAQSGPHAWNAIRLFRNALAGVRAGYIGSDQAFAGIRPVAQTVQSRYPGFDALWNDYLVGLRAFKGLPVDGSGDDAELNHYRLKIDELRNAHFHGVAYSASL